MIHKTEMQFAVFLDRDGVINKAIIRNGKIVVPSGNTIFQEGDEVLAVTHLEGARQLAQLLSPSRGERIPGR